MIHRPPPHVMAGEFRFNANSPQGRGLLLWFPAGRIDRMRTNDSQVRNQIPGGSIFQVGTSGTQFYKQSEFGPTFNFQDGTSIDLTSSATYQTPKVTFSGWVRIPSGSTGEYFLCCSQLAYSGARLIVNNGVAKMLAIDSGGSLSEASGTCTNAEWHLIHGVFGDGLVSKVYVDGVQGTDGGSISGLAYPNAPYSSYIGRYCGAPTSTYMIGDVKDVRWRNVALTKAEVQQEVERPWDLYLDNRRKRSYSIPAAGGFSTALFRENAGLGGIGGGPFARANAGLGAIA